MECRRGRHLMSWSLHREEAVPTHRRPYVNTSIPRGKSNSCWVRPSNDNRRVLEGRITVLMHDTRVRSHVQHTFSDSFLFSGWTSGTTSTTSSIDNWAENSGYSEWKLKHQNKFENPLILDWEARDTSQEVSYSWSEQSTSANSSASTHDTLNDTPALILFVGRRGSCFSLGIRFRINGREPAWSRKWAPMYSESHGSGGRNHEIQEEEKD